MIARANLIAFHPNAPVPGPRAQRRAAFDRSQPDQPAYRHRAALVHRPARPRLHDCLHVLAGYTTDSLEETQIASFQAGMLKNDPLFGLLFMLAQFQIGLQVTPITPAEKLVVDPQLMLEAFARGTRVNRDLCVDWIPERDFDRSVEELRREYNIEPRAARAAS